MGLDAGKLLSGAASTAANAFSGGLAGMGISMLNSLFSRGMSEEEAMQMQHQYELEKMGLQAQYNKEQAKYSQELAKEMWEYTNYENQVKHLKAAGMNPALLYGKGGTGGSTAGAGTAGPVAMGTSEAVGMALQTKQLSLNQQEQQANIAKTMAETAKIAGVDTEQVKAQIKEALQGIEESKARQEGIEASTDKTKAEKQTIDFQNWINEAKQKLLGVNGETYAEALSFLDWEIIDRDRQVALKEVKEALNDERVATRLSEAIDEISEGKIAVFTKLKEEAKQAKNETAIKKWEFEQEKALSDLIS